MPIPHGVHYFFEISRNDLGKNMEYLENGKLKIEIVTELRKKLMLAKSKEGEQSRLNSQF